MVRSKAKSYKTVCYATGHGLTTTSVTTYRAMVKLQRSIEQCIPKLPFSRVVREVMQDISGNDKRITADALRALQEAAEIYLVALFADCNKVVFHAKRSTLMPKDIRLVLEIRGPTDPGVEK